MDGAQEYAFNAMSHVPDDAALKTWMTQLHGIVKGALMDCLAEEKPGKAITIDTTFECALLSFCALSLLLALRQALQPIPAHAPHASLHCDWQVCEENGADGPSGHGRRAAPGGAV